MGKWKSRQVAGVFIMLPMLVMMSIMSVYMVNGTMMRLLVNAGDTQWSTIIALIAFVVAFVFIIGYASHLIVDDSHDAE